MPIEALFLNGVYSATLDDIWNVQRTDPERTLFIQPYSTSPIKALEDEPPTPDNSVWLYLSTTDDLATVSYNAEIVGWEDKTLMSRERIAEVHAIIKEYQPNQSGLYLRIPATQNESERVPVNLLHVRFLTKLPEPFSVSELIKESDRKPLSPNRQRSGGWSYVQRRAGQLE